LIIVLKLADPFSLLCLFWVKGRLPKCAKNISITGSIIYNGEEISSGNFEIGSLVAFVEQLDNNEPLLTVRETFEFGELMSAIN